MDSILTTIQNFYTYIIYISGVIAIIFLIIGGFLYLTSAGKPEQVEKAKKQILAVFWGGIIILSSYIILSTINPKLVELELPELKEIIFSPLQITPLEKTPTLLGKVREIAEKIRTEVLPGMEGSSDRILTLTDNCSCSRTQPICACRGGNTTGLCHAVTCYAGPGFNPCPDQTAIKHNQSTIIAWESEIIFYRNWSESELKDLTDEINIVLNDQIRFYQESADAEVVNTTRDRLEEKVQEKTEERRLKQLLAENLESLIGLIDQISIPSKSIGELPELCFSNVESLCTPSCTGECHDLKTGCQPVECSGPNPCPSSEIENQLIEIQNLRADINQVCATIIQIIDDLIIFKTITI